MIHHSVIYKLKYAKGSEQEDRFLEAALLLADIPGVLNFKSLRQTSTKNHFDYGLSMDFESVHDYKIYDKHPDHQHFVSTYWLDAVDDFLEIDYEPHT